MANEESDSPSRLKSIVPIDQDAAEPIAAKMPIVLELVTDHFLVPLNVKAGVCREALIIF
jgi:hypothetical protein